MNLPNKITIARIVLTFIFMFLLYLHGVIFKILALVVFLLAVYSDYLDGMLARKLDIRTDFGKLMDPVADKILVLGAMLAFVEMNLVPAWAVTVIILRELIITGLRLIVLKGNNKVIEAHKLGKHKTVAQMVSIFFILLFIIFKEAGLTVYGFWDQALEYWYRQLIFCLILVTVAYTVASGVLYINANKRCLMNWEK
ncbi:MAG: CDP-diacylglycerol--glycerol-3-phosphate 3-phosphatidyltransferase [Candidatus Omnitrophica bacterium]|nr:CDP-diacylglycerol--glycerol-3-phosphate 3-phosphatidyltransferase [Candidatus Omnitrophota bacterium]